VADDIRMARIVPTERIIHVGLAVAARRFEARRMTPRVERVSAGIVERQAEAEAASLAHLGNALQHLSRGQEVEPTELVVRPEIAPGRAWRPLLPSRVHASPSSGTGAPIMQRIGIGA